MTTTEIMNAAAKDFTTCQSLIGRKLNPNGDFITIMQMWASIMKPTRREVPRPDWYATQKLAIHNSIPYVVINLDEEVSN